MAKKKDSASKCPEPLNTMIDLAGALAMGAFAKQQNCEDGTAYGISPLNYETREARFLAVEFPGWIMVRTNII